MFGKTVACMLSGGLAPVCVILLTLGMEALLFLPMERAAAEGEAGGLFWGLAPLLQSLLLVFASGALGALTGMICAAASSSKHMAYAAPFIFSYLLIILCERYFKECYVLYPREWLCPARFPYDWAGVMVFNLRQTGGEEALEDMKKPGRELRQALAAMNYNFRLWRGNPRVAVAFSLAFILCFLLSDKVVTHANKRCFCGRIMLS